MVVPRSIPQRLLRPPLVALLVFFCVGILAGTVVWCSEREFSGSRNGLRYELWRINPQTGEKENFTVSTLDPLAEPAERVLDTPGAPWTLRVSSLPGTGDPFGLAVKIVLAFCFSLMSALLAKRLMELRNFSPVPELAPESAGWQQTEEVFQANEQRFLKFVKEFPLPMAFLNKNGVLSYVNDRLIQVLGYSHGDIPTLKEWWPLAYPDPDYRQWVMETWGQAVERASRQGGDIEPHEYRVTCKDGSVRTVVISGILFEENLLVTVQDVTERKRAEEALRASEARQRALIANIADVVAIIDRDGINRYKSPNIEKWFGWRPEEVVGFETWENIHPEDRERAGKVFADILREPNLAATAECRYRCKDGAYKWIEYTAVNLSHDPDIQGILLNYHDITERRQAEAALRESEERYRQLVESATEGVWVIDRDSRTTFVNAPIARMLGYSCEEMLRRPVADFVLPEELAVHEQEMTHRRHGKGSQYDRHFVCKDGRVITLLVSASPITDSQGRPAGSMAMLTDISERKRTEDALLREQMFNKTLLDSLPGIFYLYTYPDLHLVRWNKNHETLLGFTSEEMEGRDIMDWHVPEAQPYIRQAVDLVMEKGQNTAESPLVAKDGRQVPFLMTGIRFEVLGQLYLMGVGIDITAHKQMEMEKSQLEEKFQQSQKMEAVGRLAGGIAHDLNNLMTPVLGYGELLLEDLDSGDARRENVEQIVLAGRRASDLVRQLLAFSRKQVLEFKPLNLNETIAGFERLLRRTIREDIAIRFIPDPGIPSIRGDVGQLQQALMNLVVNAQDAMPDGGTLTIETSVTELDEECALVHQDVVPGRYVLLAISDTGHGMDSETQARIFEPFFTTKGMGKGTGLGLATTFGIVQQHGGNIWVYSEPGRGATFKIHLPVLEEQPGRETGKSAQTRRIDDLRGSETVLLVEDNEMVRNLTETLLKRLGYTVLVAENGSQALSVLDRHAREVQLLLTDVIMPEMNGRQLFSRASEKYPGLKVLYMSGYTENVIAQRDGLDEGVRLIQKPFAVQTLATRLREAIEA
jgi:PAS domain S-box-containing protein